MSTPSPDEKGHDHLSRLDTDLASFETRRRKAQAGAGAGASVGYRMLGQMLSGVLGGLGLGWFIDRIAHTKPWGLVLGLLIGAALSIFSTIRLASGAGFGRVDPGRAGPGSEARPAATAPVDDGDEDA